MLRDKVVELFDKPLLSIAKNLNINPNVVTITGFFITLLTAIIIPQNLLLGGTLILFGGIFDRLDGIIAKVNNRATDFGAFLDSLTDRYSDSFLFLGFSWYFIKTGSVLGLFLSISTMIGALITSYARARAEGLGRECRVGLMERPERIVLMAFGAITGWVIPVMVLMLVLIHFTVIQRIYHVWKIMKRE